MKSVILQAICLLLIQSNLFGQIYSIDNVYINPENPTTADTVFLIGEIRTSSAGCFLSNTDLTIDQGNNTIGIENCYHIGPLDTICPSIDTMLLGQFQAGDYQVLFRAKGSELASNPDAICTNYFNEMTKEIAISISETNAINNEQKAPLFHLIRNPAKEYALFQIKNTQANSEIIIIDNLGRVIVKQKLQNANTQTAKINIQHLPIGVYYCQLVNNKNGQSKAIKMIKH